MILLLSFAAPFAFYLAWPSTMWNFDGVACAAALELGWPLYFFHADHLLYGFFGFWFWKGAALLGLARALPALQLFNSLLACLGLVGLYRTVKLILPDDLVALFLTLGLGFTAAFWVWSVEAQVYPLGFLPLAWATYVLLNRDGERQPIWVGILHACAVLGHIMHFLWAFPALYWMREKPKAVRSYLATLFLGTLIPYALVLAFVVVPGHDKAHILMWLKGSAGLTPDRSWAWHWSGRFGPWLWLKSTAPALWGTFWPYKQTPVEISIWLLTAVSMGLVFLLLVGSGSPKRSRLAAFSWIWLLTYGLFLSTWEPATLCYRLTDIIPLGILLALGLKRWPMRFFYSTLFLGTMFIVNFSSRIQPMHDSSLNKVYQDTLTLSKISQPNSLYITHGGTPWIYLLYFTGRQALNANSMPPERLNAMISQQKNTRSVYIRDGETWRKAA